MFNLIRFIKLQPWCKYEIWKEIILKGQSIIRNVADQQIKFFLLRSILEPILMRRTKNTRDENGKKIVELPKKHIKTVKVKLHREERELYDTLFAKK